MISINIVFCVESDKYTNSPAVPLILFQKSFDPLDNVWLAGAFGFPYLTTLLSLSAAATDAIETLPQPRCNGRNWNTGT